MPRSGIVHIDSVETIPISKRPQSLSFTSASPYPNSYELHTINSPQRIGSLASTAANEPLLAVLFRYTGFSIVRARGTARKTALLDSVVQRTNSSRALLLCNWSMLCCGPSDSRDKGALIKRGAAASRPPGVAATAGGVQLEKFGKW